jgi:hypothetical protein
LHATGPRNEKSKIGPCVFGGIFQLAEDVGLNHGDFFPKHFERIAEDIALVRKPRSMGVNDVGIFKQLGDGVRIGGGGRNAQGDAKALQVGPAWAVQQGHLINALSPACK